jgi:hypothetical protein
MTGLKLRPHALMLLPTLLLLLELSAAPRPEGWAQSTPNQGSEASEQARQSPSEKTGAQDTTAVPFALPKGKKLVLTDGTSQIVREYHREGDRVRYYSVERSDWEEIPASLIDWEATQKAETELEAQQKELADKVKAELTAERVKDLDVDASFEVRSGVFLPDRVGLFVIDGTAIVPMEQEKSQTVLDKQRAFTRIITGVPLIPAKQHVEIPGKRAKIRINSSEPEFYFRTADKREPRITLLRAEVLGDKRTLETITTNVAGQQTYKNTEAPLLQWDAARGLYRFTVEQTLEPGEYAFVETTEQEGQSTYVWTFGVEGSATAKGAPSKQTKDTSH